jgi:hypothetical protein
VGVGDSVANAMRSLFKGSRGYGLDDTERALVWMLGSQRSGSTWLLNLLNISPRVSRINEIGIGPHLGVFTTDVLGTPAPSSERAMELWRESMRNHDDYFFSDRYAEVWRPELRRLILARLRPQLVELATPVPLNDRIAVIKEPVGSQAAAMILEAVPGSRLLALMRDGRDVVDSMLDAMKPEGWLSSTFGGGRAVAEEERARFLEVQSYRWVARTQAVMTAYERHDQSRRVIVRYEDALADTPGELRKVFRWLDADVDEEALGAGIEKLAFSNAPKEHKGSGRFARAASPGLWRESMSASEQDCVNSIMGDVLSKLGYEV